MDDIETRSSRRQEREQFDQRTRDWGAVNHGDPVATFGAALGILGLVVPVGYVVIGMLLDLIR